MIPVLITFPPSLDSETSRFLVEHYGIESVEKRQALIFSFFVTLWHGFTPIFPLLYGDSLRLIGPRPIVDHFDPQSSSDLKLLPTDPNNLSQVNSDWTLFNSTLAFATAKFAYYYLLPHRDLMIRPLSEGTPAFEQKAVARAYPVFAGLLRLLLQLSLSTAQQSWPQSGPHSVPSTRGSPTDGNFWWAGASRYPTLPSPSRQRPSSYPQVTVAPSHPLNKCLPKCGQWSRKCVPIPREHSRYGFTRNKDIGSPKREPSRDKPKVCSAKKPVDVRLPKPKTILSFGLAHSLTPPWLCYHSR